MLLLTELSALSRQQEKTKPFRKVFLFLLKADG